MTGRIPLYFIIFYVTKRASSHMLCVSVPCQCFPKNSYLLLMYIEQLKTQELFDNSKTLQDISSINIVIVSRCYHFFTLISTCCKATTMSSKGLSQFYQIMDLSVVFIFEEHTGKMRYWTKNNINVCNLRVNVNVYQKLHHQT